MGLLLGWLLVEARVHLQIECYRLADVALVVAGSFNSPRLSPAFLSSIDKGKVISAFEAVRFIRDGDTRQGSSRMHRPEPVLSTADARIECEAFRHDYNTQGRTAQSETKRRQSS
jgi:hypothetical protein